MPKEVNATLQQQGQLGQVREYQLVNGKELRISIGAAQRQRAYMVHLLALADKSRLGFHISWPWFYLVLSCLVGLVIYLFVGSWLLADADILGLVIVVTLSSLGLLGLVMLGLNFTRKRVFYSRHSGIPLFDILISKPDYRTYKAFLDTLTAYIAKTRSFWNLKLEQQIAGEIRMLRRLANEGVISQRDYDNAKQRLFSISNKKSHIPKT